MGASEHVERFQECDSANCHTLASLACLNFPNLESGLLEARELGNCDDRLCNGLAAFYL